MNEPDDLPALLDAQAILSAAGLADVLHPDTHDSRWASADLRPDLTEPTEGTS